MIAVLILAVLLVAVLVLAYTAITSRDETIRSLKAQRICDVLEVRKMRAERDANRQVLAETHRAIEVAREVLADELDPPIFLEVSEELAEREATILQFRSELDKPWSAS